MITKINYKLNERTAQQFKAIELKKKGYQVTRIIQEMGDDEDSYSDTIAFGYNPTDTSNIKKEIKVVNCEEVSEGDFEFIYWN